MTNIFLFLKNNGIWLILILACVLRFWHIENVPPSLYWDEVSQGYNTYSILQTGKDEHKETLPIARFQAFGDYKAPVYIYVDMPFIAFFGKTTLAVRFPSALFGSLTVLLTYFLACELFYSDKNKKLLGLSASFFLAISPWHIQLSRATYEANIATFFTVLAMVLFFLGKRTKNWLLILSVLSFVFAFYAFNAHRIFIPLFVLFLSVVFWRDLLARKREVIFGCLVGLTLLLPFLSYVRSPESRLRFNEVNIFSDISVIKDSNKHIAEDKNTIISQIVNNRRVSFGLLYMRHYFDFFNPTYLFFKGDVNPRFSTQETGELYLFMLPLILIGMYGVVKSKSKTALVLVGWFLLAPVAAATARETPHALRSETYIPLYELFAGFGIVVLLQHIKKYNAKYFLFFFLSLSIIITYYVADFLHTYYVHFPLKYSQAWQFGYKEAVQEAEKLKNNYDQIIFTNTYGRPYIYVLWYGDYSLQAYWKDGKVIRDSFGFYNVDGFGKYTFQKPSEYSGVKHNKILYVGLANEIPLDARKIDEIKFLDGSVAFEIADNQ